MSSFRWGMVACWTPTNSQVTVWELRQLLFSAHCSTVVFFCFAFCFCLSPPGWEKVLSLEMMWTWLGALSFDVNGLYESQTTFPFLWGSNLNQNKPVDPFLDFSPIQNQASLVCYMTTAKCGWSRVNRCFKNFKGHPSVINHWSHKKHKSVLTASIDVPAHQCVSKLGKCVTLLCPIRKIRLGQ